MHLERQSLQSIILLLMNSVIIMIIIMIIIIIITFERVTVKTSNWVFTPILTLLFVADHPKRLTDLSVYNVFQAPFNSHKQKFVYTEMLWPEYQAFLGV